MNLLEAFGSSPPVTESGNSRRRGMNLNLPEELQIEIVANLPVKSLMRFKSVAKSWKNIFKSPSFVSKQLSASSAKNKSNPLLMVYQNQSPGSHLFTLISQDGPSPILERPFADEDWHYIRPCGSCNGIFCLHSYRMHGLGVELILWNPSTREVKAVPSPLIPPSVKHLGPLYGFGVDPNTNAYKIVKLMFSAPHGSYEKPAIAEVYNLATDSWRIIQDTVPASYIEESWRFNSYVNGVYCWMSGWGYERAILCFDMRSETFERIELPPPAYVSSLSNEAWHSGVSITNGRICYFCKYLNRNYEYARLEVSVMSDYDGVERTWTRSSFTLEDKHLLEGFLGFWKDGEMIHATELSEQLLSYKFDNSKMWRVGEIQVDGEKCGWLREYVENIVPLNVSVVEYA